MKPYHKIKTVFLRDPETKFKKLLMGQWALPEFDYLQSSQWVGTEKVDGTNIRVGINTHGNVEIGGRTEKSNVPKHLEEVLLGMFDTQAFHTLTGVGKMTFYGEGYGRKIQKAGQHYGETSFVLFDIFYDGEMWLKREDVDDIARQLGIKSVPVVFEGTLLQAVKVVESGQDSLLGDLTSEGLILTPKGGFLDRHGNRVITKIKHKDF